MRLVIQNRNLVSVAFAAMIGVILVRHAPFPEDSPLLQLVWLAKPDLFQAIKWAYLAMLFSTPYMACSLVLSFAYIFLVRHAATEVAGTLPSYPVPAGRDRLFLVLGEVHHPRKAEPSECPQWLIIPDRGLFTGIAVVGAIGTGKTSGCMMPFAQQILAYAANDKEKRVGGLVLEVKGDFCHKVRVLLEKYGRGEDYLEISLAGDCCYNPLHNDQDAYTLAFGIASLLNNLFGRGKEPFWQQAYTNLVKFLILLHKVLYDYVTLFDVYECAINPKLLEEKIVQGEALLAGPSLLVEIETFEKDPALDDYDFVLDHAAARMKAPYSEALAAYLQGRGTAFELQTETGPCGGRANNERKRQQFEAVKRWYFHDWSRIEPRLRTSIIEGISVFLSLFDDNPEVRRVFCPPQAAYDPAANADGRYGRPMPPFGEAIEQGKVVALNFPVSLNPGLARMLGTLLKLDFERAVLNRIPAMERHPDRHWREVLFLCDEYQAFATVGEHDPTGDEKFFSLSRQAKCIAIVATQSLSSLRSTLPGESWRTLLQTFRTKIFLALSDDFSAETASRFCGKEEMLKPSYSLAENGPDARVSMLTGRATSHKSALSASKTYSTQMLPTFEPKVFAELKNAQAIVLAYDGTSPWPPTYCYLKPYYLDMNLSYFEQVAKGLL